MGRAERRARTERVKRRVRRRQQRFGLRTDPREVGRLAAAPHHCTHAFCCNPRRVFGQPTRQERAALGGVVAGDRGAAELTDHVQEVTRDWPWWPFMMPGELEWGEPDA